MNRIKCLLPVKGIIPLLAVLAFQSCAPSGGGGSRKKMPELTGIQGVETYVPYGMQAGNSAFPFATGYVDLMANGRMETLFSVALPDAGEDSLVLSLINHYRPLAVMMLTQWAQQQQNGVLIDLRTSPINAPRRADFTLQKQDAFSLPVVFLWDGSSAGRAASYMNLLGTAPGISVTRLSNSGGASFEGQNSFNSCF